MKKGARELRIQLEAGRRGWCRAADCRNMLFVLVALFFAGCGAQKSHVETNEKTDGEKAADKFVRFVAVTSGPSSFWMCRYTLSYDQSSVIAVSKACPDNLDQNVTVSRTYETSLTQDVQAKLQGSIDSLHGAPILASYTGKDPQYEAYDAYDLQLFREDGSSVSLYVNHGGQEALPEGLLRIYRAIVDGELRSMQNPNDAASLLLPVDDATAASTVVRVSTADYDGGLSFGCTCDGDPNVHGINVRRKSIGQDGSIEQWAGCERRATFTGDPNSGIRCHTDELKITPMAPEQWLALKKQILSANPLVFAEHYPCGSYIDCPSDYGGSGLTIDVGAARRDTSWASGTEAQLPARLQFLLSVLP